jgi:hypothetical protein
MTVPEGSFAQGCKFGILGMCGAQPSPNVL